MSIISFLQFIAYSFNKLIIIFCYILLLLAYIPETKALNKNRLYEERIVGGTPCTMKTHPYMVAVLVQNKIGLYSPWCGGSLVNGNWVLSAAHCFSSDTNLDMEEFLVAAGVSYLPKHDDPDVQKSEISRIVFREYDSIKNDNDIALLKLKRFIYKSDTVDYVALPRNNLHATNLLQINPICTAMGWGSTAPKKYPKWHIVHYTSYSKHLLCVNLPLIGFEQCKKALMEINPFVQLLSSQICTLHPEAGKDACQGDSGGPLVCNRVQQGITSWGFGCAQKGYPGVFTRVDIYVAWIKSVCGKVNTHRLTIRRRPKG